MSAVKRRAAFARTRGEDRAASPFGGFSTAGSRDSSERFLRAAHDDPPGGRRSGRFSEGDVFPDFLDWIGEDPFILRSWGEYDLTQFRIDCIRHGLEFPPTFERHVNLKKQFARLFGFKVSGLERALAQIGLPLEGTHRRGIDDARNIAR